MKGRRAKCHKVPIKKKKIKKPPFYEEKEQMKKKNKINERNSVKCKETTYRCPDPES
jgi:hypothetical protein